MREHLKTRKIKVGLLDVGDGRSFLQAPWEPVNRENREKHIGLCHRAELLLSRFAGCCLAAAGPGFAGATGAWVLRRFRLGFR